MKLKTADMRASGAGGGRDGGLSTNGTGTLGSWEFFTTCPFAAFGDAKWLTTKDLIHRRSASASIDCNGLQINDEEEDVNRNYRNVWSDAAGTWVAVPETASTHGKKSRGKTLHSVVCLVGAGALLSLSGQALAACTVNAGVSATANAGDNCSVTGASFINSGTAVSASGGATMNLTAPAVTARASAGFGIDISGATVNSNSLTASGGGITNARAIAGRAGSVLTVDGDLTATRVGGGTLGAAVDFAGAGSVMTVTGKSTITSTVAADGVRSTAGSQIFFNGDTSITTVNTAVISQTSGSLLGTGVTGSSLVEFGGNVVAKSTGAAGGFVASGNLGTGNRIVVVGNADVSTTAANGGAAMTASAGGSIRVGGTTTASTAGASAHGVLA
ncbi:MAG TPA: ESPR-type extended signal peptide-containing protein, partial [Burkholderiaceae bacterium]|nr:ESPR-type extended signal peptide-containing protein [Burkholderiaceae bacterium]